MNQATKQVQVPPRESIRRIRFDSERKLFDALSSDRLIAQVAGGLRKNNEEDAHRRRLLATALRITDRIIPSLKERIALVKKVLHLEGREVETFIYNSPQYSASCMCFEKEAVFLMISSGLYSALTERELLFVVGHEFGRFARFPRKKARHQESGEGTHHATVFDPSAVPG